MQQPEVRSVDDELETLKQQITDPDNQRLLMLVEKINSDHQKVQEALNYAEIPDEDYRELLELIQDN